MKQLNVLVACERSRVVASAFELLGHFAVSCDIEPCTVPDPDEMHYQGDVFDLLREPWRMIPGGKDHAGGWDLLIAHPPCTYLTCSAEWAYKDGPHHMRLRPGTLTGALRRRARIEACEFFMALWNANVPCIAIENPVGIMSSYFRKPDQIVHPWQFGDDASKATCLWFKNLSPLELRPSDFYPPRVVCRNGKSYLRWSNQTDSGQNRLSPSDDRAFLRAVTYPGIARAMARQWGT